jgi:antitoxin YefM
VVPLHQTGEIDVSISASEARKTLFPLIERVNDDRDAVEIVSRKGNAVLISAEEYAAWQETAYLFRSPANARRLLDAYERARSGETESHELDRDQ